MRIFKTAIEYKEDKAVRYLDYSGNWVNIIGKMQSACTNVLRAMILMDTYDKDDRIDGVHVVKVKA